jgi:hypothetical protein
MDFKYLYETEINNLLQLLEVGRRGGERERRWGKCK